MIPHSWKDDINISKDIAAETFDTTNDTLYFRYFAITMIQTQVSLVILFNFA
ncbi:hypothetical protein [Pedobacter sp. NJ-S-72]